MNPISNHISVPFESNFNFGIGPTQSGFQYLLNIKPVYPVSMIDGWNFIARMIMPVIYQNEIFPGAGSQFGLGDTTFQFFFSPKAPTPGGIIWGVGPTFLVPTGTDPLLSGRTWGLRHQRRRLDANTPLQRGADGRDSRLPDVVVRRPVHDQ